MADYSYDLHSHRFAAWAAGSASSVKGKRFSVALAQRWLEGAGFDQSFELSQLPDPEKIDAHHKVWRNALIGAAKEHGFDLSHGQAAKLINVYMKARFVCGGQHTNKSVAALHPPIDKVLLDRLGSAEVNFNGQGNQWRRISRAGWSNLDSDGYDKLIGALRKALGAQPFWTLEAYWQGHQ
jgi:hypothetical protein